MSKIEIWKETTLRIFEELIGNGLILGNYPDFEEYWDAGYTPADAAVEEFSRWGRDE